MLNIVQLQPASAQDFDTGVGNFPQVLVGIALPGAGGPSIGGTAAAPLRIDPTGATQQPVSHANFANLDAALSSLATKAQLPVTLDTGNLRVMVENSSAIAVTGPVTQSGVWNIGTVTTLSSITNPVAVTNANLDTPLSGLLSTAAFQARIPVQGQAAMAASVPVVIASNQSAVSTISNDVTVTGSITTNGQTVVIPCTGMGTIRFSIYGTWTGTIVFEGTIDGANWTSVGSIPSPVIAPGGSGAVTSSTTANGQWNARIGGLAQFRVRATATITGTANITFVANQSSGFILAALIDDGNVDPNNSTTTPLAGNATFTGTATDMLPYTNLTICTHADQVGTLYVEFSHDGGVTWDVSVPYAISANQQDNFVFHRRARHFRIRWVNGATPQTTFHIQTIFQRVAAVQNMVGINEIIDDNASATLARSVISGKDNDSGLYRNVRVSPQGGLFASIVDSRDTGFGGQVSPIGDLIVGEPLRLIGPSFQGSTLDPSFFATSGVVGSGTVAVGASVATLSTGVTANSAVALTTTRRARFLFAQPNKARWVIATTDTGTVNNIRRIAVFDGTDGIGFVISGVAPNNFGVCYQKSGGGWVDVLSNFNGVLGTTKSWTNGYHALEVVYFTAGIWWFLDGRLLHFIIPTSAPTVGNLNLPLYASNTNSGGSTTNVSLAVWNMSVLRMGATDPRPTYTHLAANATTTVKQGTGRLHKVVINNPGFSTITLYDNIAGSGSIIAIMAGGAGGGSSVAAPYEINYDLDFYTGLTIVIGGGGAPDITVVFD